MKKKALVAGVLLSVFSMGMSAQAAMTISDAGETVLNEADVSYWTDLWNSDTEAGLTINGNNEKNILLKTDDTSTGPALIDVTNSSKQGDGIYHNGGTTTINGLALSISGLDASLGENPGYRAINNQSGKLIFNNDVSIATFVNDETIHNNGTLEFNGNSTKISRIYTTSDTRSMDAAIENHGTIKINSKEFLISSGPNGGLGGRVLDNNGAFYLNPNNEDGNYMINGDIRTGVDTVTVINLKATTDDSYASLQGDISVDGGNGFQLNLTGEKASWILGSRKSQDVPNVSLKDNALIILNVANFSPNANWTSGFKNLALTNLKNDGTGLIQLTTDLKNNVGDRVTLFFNNQTPTLSSLNIGIINKDDNNGVEIKESDGHSVTIARVEGTEKIKLNTYLSFYNRSDEGEIKLMNPIIKEEAFSNMHDMLNGHDYNFVGWEKGGTKTVDNEGKQGKDALDLHATELDNTLKRINDIRTDPSEVGAWLRGENGKMKIRSYGYKYNLMSGGYDWKYESDAAKMFLGFGISYAKNNCDTGIIGDTKSMGYNLYGSWLGRENNDYMDVIVKYGTLDKKYAGLDDNNVFVTGDYDKKLFSVAAKYGRRITRDDGWYYEPSVGLTWGRIGSADFTDSQGIHIHADSSTSKMVTLGMQVGKNIQGTEFYGLFQVRHDFDGKMHVSVPGSDLPGSSVYDDMGGTWYKVGIGAARKINKNNSFYMDIEKDFGNKVKKPYAIGAGYRYTF
ncbi:autotransporter outer membrane beta-barrel domain-containing protein [Phascolarctobacterium sp.]